MANRRVRVCWYGSAAIFAVFGMLVPGVRAASPPLEIVTCGQTVDHSLRVANNLEDCPADGLVVAADNITILLDGHRIDGDDDGTHAGIYNLGHVGVTIRDGTITEFQFGVSFSSNAQGTVVGVQAYGNRFGIDVSNSFAKSSIKKNVVSGNTQAGLRVFGSTASVFQDNTVIGNSLLGIDINFAENATFVKNRVSGNGARGIDLRGANITLKGNLVSGNGQSGIVVATGSNNNLLKGNVISANGSHGIEVVQSPDNRFVGNVVSGNDVDGIAVTASAGNVLAGNLVSENGRHGISSDSSDLVLTGNRANRNGFLGGGGGDDVGAGIAVVAGTMNAGNKATDNDDPHECQPSDLTCFDP